MLILGTVGCSPAAVTFPDTGLEAAVREAIDKPEGNIYLSELETVTSLGAGNRNISNLSGLEKLSNLTWLVLSENEISDLSPLANLTELQNLYLDWNQIEDISPLAKLDKLVELDLFSNRISDIPPLATLTELESLSLGLNLIEDISPLVSLTSLKFLSLIDNPLSDESTNLYISLFHLQRGVETDKAIGKTGTGAGNPIDANHVHIQDGEYILFSGDSTLPEGTQLQSQLYEDELPLPWWPADELIIVRGGQWRITVRLGKDGTPDKLLSGPGYRFNIWQQSNPSIKASMYFDLVGPPAPPTQSSGNETENDGDLTPTQQPVEIVSVVGPLEPINPGGPIVEITLKNVAAEPVVSLTVSLELSRAFDFTFDVTDASPLLPGESRSVRKTLITGGFSDTVRYPLTVSGKLQSGREFAYTEQVFIEAQEGR